MKKLQILGTGCAKCKALQECAELVAQQAGLAYEIEKITDIPRMMQFGIMATPALAIDGKVVSQGRVPNIQQMQTLLQS